MVAGVDGDQSPQCRVGVDGQSGDLSGGQRRRPGLGVDQRADDRPGGAVVYPVRVGGLVVRGPRGVGVDDASSEACGVVDAGDGEDGGGGGDGFGESPDLSGHDGGVNSRRPHDDPSTGGEQVPLSDGLSVGTKDHRVMVGRVLHVAVGHFRGDGGADDRVGGQRQLPRAGAVVPHHDVQRVEDVDLAGDAPVIVAGLDHPRGAAHQAVQYWAR